MPRKSSTLPITAEARQITLSPEVLKLIRGKGKKFPGARRMGLSFKDAVEQFTLVKYGHRMDDALTKADIFRDDKKLYVAFDNYEKQIGHTPFNIPSTRTLARERFERVVSVGLESAPRRDRDAAHKMAKRIVRKLDSIAAR
jgi:hypothetical protein